MGETRKEFGEIMDDAVERTMMALFDEINLILDRIQKDEDFIIQDPKVKNFEKQEYIIYKFYKN